MVINVSKVVAFSDVVVWLCWLIFELLCLHKSLPELFGPLFWIRALGRDKYIWHESKLNIFPSICLYVFWIQSLLKTSFYYTNEVSYMGESWSENVYGKNISNHMLSHFKMALNVRPIVLMFHCCLVMSSSRIYRSFLLRVTIYCFFLTNFDKWGGLVVLTITHTSVQEMKEGELQYWYENRWI